MEKTVFVLWWRYGDGSGQEIVRVHENEDRANQDFELAELDASRTWHLDEVPYFEIT